MRTTKDENIHHATKSTNTAKGRLIASCLGDFRSDQSALHLVVLILLFLLLLIAIFLLIAILILLRLLILVAIEVHHGVLLILILRDQIAHVLIGLLELHLVHSLAFVPMQESLALIHFREMRRNALENALNRRRIRHEGAAHRSALGRNGDNA